MERPTREQEGLSVVIKMWFLDQQQHHLGVSQNVHPWAPPTWVFTVCSCDSTAHSIPGLTRPFFLLGHTPHPDEVGTGYQGKQGQSSSPQSPLLTFDPRITALKKQLCFNLKNPPLKLPLSPDVCNMFRFLSNPPCFLIVCYVSVITYFLLPTVLVQILSPSICSNIPVKLIQSHVKKKKKHVKKWESRDRPSAEIKKDVDISSRGDI